MKVLGSNKNFLALNKENSSYQNSKIVLFSVNDGKSISNFKTVENILSASHKLNRFDEEQGKDTCGEVGIATLEPINTKGLSPQKIQTKISKIVESLLNDKKFIFTLSSGQSVPSIVIQTVAQRSKSFTLLRLGAFSDLKENKLTGSSSFINDIADAKIEVVQLGIRKESSDENLLRKEQHIKTFYTREIRLGMYGNTWHELIASNIKSDVYISIDLNFFEPSIFTFQSRPEPGGMFWDETLDLLKIIAHDNRVIGFDINGFGNSVKNNPSNYYASKLIYKLLNYSFINR